MLELMDRSYKGCSVRKLFPKAYLQAAMLCAIGCATWGAECLAQREPPKAGSSVRKFLQNYLGAPASDEDKSTRYFAAFADLSGHGKQDVIVYITGRNWCGSGGCTTLILAPNKSSYSVVANFTISRPPIRVLASKSNGWHDISVHVQGGGIQPGYDAQLLFDGKTYPRNPSVPPARPLTEKARGNVVVSTTDEGRQLYE